MSLFDLEADPQVRVELLKTATASFSQEVTNLASLHAGLVEELLKEAGELVVPVRTSLRVITPMTSR